MAKRNPLIHGLLLVGVIGLSYVIVREVNAPTKIVVGEMVYINKQGMPVTGIGGGVRTMWDGLTAGNGRDISVGFRMFYAGITGDPLGIASIILIASWIILQLYMLYRRRAVKNITVS